MNFESHLSEFLEVERFGDLSELTGKQLRMIDESQGKTIREERKLSTRLASLQEDIVDKPLASKMKKEGDDDDHECENADEALNEHSHYMAGVMEEADELRMKTLKEIVLSILAPVHAVEYLAATKRISMSKSLYLSYGAKTIVF
ncbi:hypothetical protein K7X08_018008 [Anisodus acutangulus]|uniref:DOG1 domain-containing protein n=1 Tax=Anisodus acutangulus TaxID=402998 RepID=A0A9Q1LYV2_9SOLA|nr:hypothetical protein K7X08_018008 [Anisodus acutangulus]